MLNIKKILGKIFSRAFVFIVMILAQIFFLGYAVNSLLARFSWIYLFLIILDFILGIYILNRDEEPSYQILWLILISVSPLFGGLTYVYIKNSQKFPKSISKIYRKESLKYLTQDKLTLSEVNAFSTDAKNLASYVKTCGPYPVYSNTSIEYYSLGELQFEAMLRELNKAERFIFMEFFIISQGYMFDAISEILIRKAHEGLEVRLMYDGIGTGMLNMPSSTFKMLEENGVKCRQFNPFTPFLSSIQNNRDHRKTVVIDGHTAFNGGTNLADEYINKIERFGHWKDTAIMIKGEAVWSYTFMFLQLWEFGIKNKTSYKKYMPRICDISRIRSDGFVQPFATSPLDNDRVGKMVYLNLINQAKDYVYITTPYLVLDHELKNALKFAAQKNVKIYLITPHIPDKWYVHHIAWNIYPELIKAGVKIYEYTPGFIHSKSCIADGNTAVIGTINLDYRSLFLHFESASILYGCSVIHDMKRDFEETLSLSQRITLEDCAKRPLIKKISGCIFRIFAPLL